jgi:hypothetical protein
MFTTDGHRFAPVVDGNNLIPPFVSLAGIGENTALNIVAARQECVITPSHLVLRHLAHVPTWAAYLLPVCQFLFLTLMVYPVGEMDSPLEPQP